MFMRVTLFRKLCSIAGLEWTMSNGLCCLGLALVPLENIPINFKILLALEALDSSSGVYDQQSVGLSPGRGTCLLEQDILPSLLCPFDGTISRRSCVLELVVHEKNPEHLEE